MSKTIWIGAIGGILLLIALLLNWLVTEDFESVSTPDSTQSETLETHSDEQAQEPGDKATDPDPDHEAEAETADKQDIGEDALAKLFPPEFDVVRINPNGDTVMAGRANPGATVLIIDNGADLGETEADNRGEWVYLPTSPLDPGPHELKLKSTLPDGRSIFGKKTVILVVPEPGEDVAGRKTDNPEAQQPLAILVPDNDGEINGSEVMQLPSTQPGASISGRTQTSEPEGVSSRDGTLRIETIDYNAEGRISMGGKGPGHATILAYLDNGLRGAGKVDGNGDWRINPDKYVAPGVYTLRLDAMRDGAIIARLELPFSRAEPIRELNNKELIIVQPGNSLWRIARQTLGSGYSYTIIYEANEDQIGNPDLIYPGQVFEIPKN